MMRHRVLLLSSSFRVNAELRTSMAELRRVMGNMPNMRPISTGTRLRYMVRDSTEKEDSIAELTASSVTFNFFFDAPSPYAYRRNLAKFVALLAYLGGAYAVKLDDIYGYIIEALRHDDELRLKPDTRCNDSDRERIEVLSEVNQSLARELLLLDRRAKGLEDRIRIYEAFAGGVMGRLKSRGYRSDREVSEALVGMGVDASIYEGINKLAAAGGPGDKHG